MPFLLTLALRSALFSCMADDKEKAAKKLMGKAPQDAQRLFNAGKQMKRNEKRAEWYAKNGGKNGH